MSVTHATGTGHTPSACLGGGGGVMFCIPWLLDYWPRIATKPGGGTCLCFACHSCWAIDHASSTGRSLIPTGPMTGGYDTKRFHVVNELDTLPADALQVRQGVCETSINGTYDTRVLLLPCSKLNPPTSVTKKKKKSRLQEQSITRCSFVSPEIEGSAMSVRVHTYHREAHGRHKVSVRR